MNKHLTLLLLLACLSSFGISAANAAPIRSDVIGEDGQPQDIQIPANKMMIVLNFAQPAGQATASLTVTKPGSNPVQVRYAVDLNTSKFEPASRDTYIPGPATVTVSPGSGYLVYLTYKLVGN